MPHTIAIVAHYVDRLYTGPKYLWLARWLKAAGYDPLFLAWDEGALTALKEFPLLRITCEKQPVDVLTAGQEFVKLLSRPLVEHAPIPSPTLGELLGMDDFLGSAQAWRLGGADALRPHAVVCTIPGIETQTPEDATLALALYRFCKDNHIPRIGIEISPLINDQKLVQWPVDVLLTKADPRNGDGALQPHIAAIATHAFPLPVAHRYCLRIGHVDEIEDFLKAEQELRSKLGPPGSRFLLLPFHLGFKDNVVRLLEGMISHVPALIEAGFRLLIACDPNGWRRTVSEKDMIRIGLQRWLAHWPDHWAIIEGCPNTFLALASDAVLAPCHSVLSEWCEQLGQTVIYAGQEERLADLACHVSVAEAVAWMLNDKKDE